MRVAVLGASPNPDRYSNKAVAALMTAGHEVYPVHPLAATIHGAKVIRRLADCPGTPDTVTVYVGPAHIGPLIPEIIKAGPRRIIANPGAESDELRAAAAAAHIDYVEACTLVMLRTGQF